MHPDTHASVFHGQFGAKRTSVARIESPTLRPSFFGSSQFPRHVGRHSRCAGCRVRVFASLAHAHHILPHTRFVQAFNASFAKLQLWTRSGGVAKEPHLDSHSDGHSGDHDDHGKAEGGAYATLAVDVLHNIIDGVG